MKHDQKPIGGDTVDKDQDLKKGNLPVNQHKPDAKRVETVTPDNDNGAPGAPSETNSSNKGTGTPGENL